MARDEEHRHEGTFAEGQEQREHHPEDAHEHGDFAEGEELEEHHHEGSFAEGQERREHHAEDDPHGRFSRGEEAGTTTESD